MGWETRERGGLYHTRSVRVGGRVTRQYVGSGEAAELITQMEALDRERRAEERDQARQARATVDALDREVCEATEAAELLFRGAMLLAGYHRHDRGQWRE